MADGQPVHDVRRTYDADHDLLHPDRADLSCGAEDGVAAPGSPAPAERRPPASAAFGPGFPERSPNRKECEHTVQSNPGRVQRLSLTHLRNAGCLHLSKVIETQT